MLHPNTRIVTCGGTPLDDPHSLSIHRAIVTLADRKRPRAVFFPTAGGDMADAGDRFAEVYGKRLGCATQVLYVLKHAPPMPELRAVIAKADIIYVGGGNTLKMMRRWRYLGIDRMLRGAHRRGTVLAGSSAGALCWYAFGHSDSMAFYRPEAWDYIRVRGLGILPVTACPHVHGEGRLASFESMMRRRGGIGIAIDDRAAVMYVGNTYRVLRHARSHGVFTVTNRDGHVCTRPVPAQRMFRPVQELFTPTTKPC